MRRCDSARRGLKRTQVQGGILNAGGIATYYSERRPGPPAGRIPLEVKGAGLIGLSSYRQPGRLNLHPINRAGAERGAGRSADSDRAT
jgi:hypothetical protein